MKRGAENNKEVEARLLLQRRESGKGRREKEVTLENNPNKTKWGDLKGRRADLEGSENDVSDLKRKRLKL